MTKPPTVTPTSLPQPRGAFQVSALLDLIARAEANRGYDSYYAGALVRPRKPVSQMTLAEVRAWQSANARSVSTAIGRYQFIARTLQGLMSRMRTPPNAIFSPALQDQYAIDLLQRRGLASFMAGTMTPEAFASSISREWAGLPRDASGVSYYAGTAGNVARVSWSDLISVLRGLS